MKWNPEGWPACYYGDKKRVFFCRSDFLVDCLIEDHDRHGILFVALWSLLSFYFNFWILLEGYRSYLETWFRWLETVAFLFLECILDNAQLSKQRVSFHPQLCLLGLKDKPNVFHPRFSQFIIYSFLFIIFFLSNAHYTCFYDQKNDPPLTEYFRRGLLSTRFYDGKYFIS